MLFQCQGLFSYSEITVNPLSHVFLLHGSLDTQLGYLHLKSLDISASTVISIGYTGYIYCDVL
jgi:hypothetical protein